MRKSYQVALGGILAALAVVVMMLGGFIPVATYISPMLCAVLLLFIKNLCGTKIGWTWYFLVCLLSLLFSPDKEAAGVFVALGYYPMIQSLFEKSKLSFLWKILYFNLSSGILYLLLMYLFGMEQLLLEFQELGIIGLIVILLLGNISFVLLDKLLHLVKMKFMK